MVSQAAKNAREEIHGGTSRFKIIVTLVNKTTRKQAEGLGTKLKTAIKASESVVVEEYCEGGFAGKSIIQKIEIQMDERRKTMQQIVVDTGKTDTNPKWVINRGRYEGFAKSLALLRGSSVKYEIQRSNERLGIS